MDANTLFLHAISYALLVNALELLRTLFIFFNFIQLCVDTNSFVNLRYEQN